MNVKKISKQVVILVIGFIYLTGCTATRGGLEQKSLQPPFPSREYQELIHQGDHYFSKMHLYGWRQAETFYNKAYEMKPSPGLGDKRFLALCLTAIREKHEKIVNPLVYKEIDVLAASEGFPKTQKYRESNQVFDFMLANQEMYRGEAYYYKAYNYYHMKEPVKARELIDRAKSLLPLSGEVFFLSGLLYYNQGKLKEAEKDFLRTLYDNQYSPCYPLYYLGLIKLKNQDWSFIKDFLDSIRHFELAVENMSNKLNEIDLMEIEVHQKEWMKKRQKGTKKSSGY